MSNVLLTVQAHVDSCARRCHSRYSHNACDFCNAASPRTLTVRAALWLCCAVLFANSGRIGMFLRQEWNPHFPRVPNVFLYLKSTTSKMGSPLLGNFIACFLELANETNHARPIADMLSFPKVNLCLAPSCSPTKSITSVQPLNGSFACCSSILLLLQTHR